MPAGEKTDRGDALMLARISLSLIVCTLVACGENPRAPVEDRVPHRLENEHIVARGDTLYSIAFRYGLDYRKVATANGIPAPYTIYPGQRIRLEEAPLPTAPVATAYPGGAFPGGTSVSHAEPVSGDSGPATEPEPPAQPVPVRKAPVPSAADAPKPGAPPAGAVGAWQWPTTGPVTRGFSTSVHKGIDIGGNRGDPVVAVAAGSVVYAGTGIVGFGELLIVKHNEVYLSAYGHNDALPVAEGESVAAGQTPARKGSSGTDTVKLHFEIRKEGKPIDPQRVLPRR